MKLISLNIEGDNHYDRIFPFFTAQQPDVICVQEMFAVDLPMFEEKLGMKGVHLPLLRANLAFPEVHLHARGDWGLALFSMHPLQDVRVGHYVKKEGELPIYHGTNANELNRAVLTADVAKDGVTYKIATTHFTWSPRGTVTDLQRHDLRSLFKVLDEVGDCILCGDFNAPRGREIFDALATRFTDNIPRDVKTTIDQHLHRQPGITFVVDGLFTSPVYTARDVRVVDGVSDHCAIVATITKNV